ncbi:MAG TPA: hypothetical protein VMV53_06080 [Acidimicrobiales bacterium]|nr:hypothetical protein [Acidimicrobiales bacterium]
MEAAPCEPHATNPSAKGVGDTEGTPTCSSGPLGRLSWTISELIGIVRARH